MSLIIAEDADAYNARLLKKSIEFEQAKAQNKILAGFTSVWLDEFEGQWDNDEKCASIEIAEHYITCATYMKRAFQRDYGRYVEQVQDWIDGQLITPWEH